MVNNIVLALEVRASVIQRIIIDMVSKDIIKSMTYEEVTNMDPLEAAYTILRHSKTYLTNQVYTEDSDDDSENAAFFRLQRFITHVNLKPPVKEHLKVVTWLRNEIYLHKDGFGIIPEMIKRAKPILHEYLVDISRIAQRAIRSDRALRAYLSGEHKFYVPPTTVDHTHTKTGNAQYDDYCTEIDKLQMNTETVKGDVSLFQWYYSSGIFDVEGMIHQDSGMPFMLNIIPRPITDLFLLRRPTELGVKLRSRSPNSVTTFDSASYYPFVTNPLQPYFTITSAEYSKFDLPGTATATPFPEWFTNNETGLPTGGTTNNSGTTGETGNTGEGQGDNETRTGDETGTTGDEAPTSGNNDNDDGEDDNGPDDTGYAPDTMLERLARDYTKAYMDMNIGSDEEGTHLYMSRFDVNNENGIGRTISKSQLKKGDWKITVRDRSGIRRYLVTYTRRNNKPTFSLIT